MLTKRTETIGVVVVAAGSSQRMAGQDKILAPLAGKPVLLHAIEPFLQFPGVGNIVLVLNQRNIKPARALLEKAGIADRVTTCLGGKRRQDSVLFGLEHLGKCDVVIIHDGARPLLTADLMNRGLEAACETGAAIAAVPVADTLKLAGPDMIVALTPPREGFWQAQTPQVFRRDVLEAAFQYNDQDVTDEAQLVELTGGKVKLYMGAYDNIKITAPGDLVIARALLRLRHAEGRNPDSETRNKAQ